MKNWKRRGFSKQNHRIMKKNEVNRSCSVCCIARTRVLLYRQTMNSTLVANWLLAAKATNNRTAKFKGPKDVSLRQINTVYTFCDIQSNLF